MPVFGSLDRLTAALGPEQPWVARPLQNVQVIMGGTGVDRVLLDPEAEPGTQRWNAGPPCPDGGDAALNQNLKVVLEMIGTLNLQASGVIDSDSAKLKTAHDRYANTETSLTQLCTEISDPSKIG